MSRRWLQIAVATLGLLPILTGLAVFVLGPARMGLETLIGLIVLLYSRKTLAP